MTVWSTIGALIGHEEETCNDVTLGLNLDGQGSILSLNCHFTVIMKTDQGPCGMLVWIFGKYSSSMCS